MEDKKYRVRHYQDNTYEVLEKKYHAYESNERWGSVFKGSLADCEAYIRLREYGYM